MNKRGFLAALTGFGATAAIPNLQQPDPEVKALLERIATSLENIEQKLPSASEIATAVLSEPYPTIFTSGAITNWPEWKKPDIFVIGE